MVAVGLFYRMGYMAQRLTPTGEQTAVDVPNEVSNIAMECVRNENGEPLEISLPLPGRELHLRAWSISVGRVALYLLDTNTPSNRPEDCDITRNLYGGDSERRLQQEIVLGRGGVRLLQRLGVEPSVYHINEGHAAFLTLERVGALVRQHGLTFDEARGFVRGTTMFTTHTPVPAGHDRFGEDLMRRYFSDVHEWLGVPWERFYALGHSDEQRDAFNVTYLALNLSAFANGVSKLHGVASRELLRPFWPRLLASEVPIDTITNGIHLASWTHPGICRLLGVERRAVRGEDFAARARTIDRRALWEFKTQAKRRLLEQVGRRLRKAFLQRHDSPRLLARTLEGLDSDALWIGFARRFAPYKRAHLAFLEPQRLRALCDRAEHPVRLIVAGKAHPRDEHGKQILRSIVEITRGDDFVGKVFFLEDYDMEVARALVQGVDVWLNNPLRMLEASGTSGMKASANGGLNLSIGDGWWSEAYNGKNGWRIGDERVYENQELQDQLDAGTLYNLIEEELLPLFTQRDKDGLPQGWLDRIVENLATIPPVFNTDRMVEEYRERGYDKLGRQFHELTAERNANVKTRARELARIRRGFADIKIVGARIADLSSVHVGDPIDVNVEVELGSLAPDDVVVEFVLGHTNGSADLHNATCVELEEGGKNGAAHTFQGTYVAERSGSYAYGIRVRGRDQSDPSDVLRDLVLWA
jgi:alpha-glucan phosphorylase-like protein